MSFEGWDQVLCRRGHMSGPDVYMSFDYGTEDTSWKCHCGAPAAWHNQVDNTNGDAVGEIELEIDETEESDTCDMGHVHVVKTATYQFPKGCGRGHMVNGGFYNTVPDGSHNTEPTCTVIRQTWTESERGWGCRPDGISLHLNSKDMEAFNKEYWEEEQARNPSGKVPEEYTRPDDKGTAWLIDEDTYAKVQDSENGIRVWQHETRDKNWKKL